MKRNKGSGAAAARGRRRRSRRGFTLVEVGLAMTVLMVALLAMSATTLRTHSLRRQNRERAIAQNGIRLMSEHIHAISDRILRDSNGDTALWTRDLTAALSPGGELGSTFDIAELNALANRPAVGTVRMVFDETVTDAALGLELGMPRDLDGDGLADNADVSGNARILPVVLVADWSGVSGDQRITHPFFVIGY